MSTARPDLLTELNDAMSQIYDENRFYNQQIHEKYMATSGTNAFLSSDALHWLDEHGAIRVGYLDNYLPFCAKSSGGVTGVLNDYLTLAKTTAKNARLNFETYAYPNLEAALEALRAGNIDCVFPVNISAYDGEESGVMATSPILQTEMYLVVNRGNQNQISAEQPMTIAVDRQNINHATFLKDNFPKWTILNCNGLEECFSAVESGKANGAILSNYRVIQTENLLNRYGLLALTTGKSMDFSFVVLRSESKLYHILNKTASLIPHAAINSALTLYSYPENKFSLIDFLRRNWIVVILVVVAAAILIIRMRDRQAKLREKDLADRLQVQNQLLENERKVREVDAMINAVAADYRSVFYVDLDNDESICYRAKTTTGSQASDIVGVKKGDHFPFLEKFIQYANTFVAEPYRADFLNFIKPENIRAKLAKELITAHRYLAVRDGKEYYEMIRVVNINPVLHQNTKDIHSVSIGFADVDSETRETLQRNRALSDALQQAETANAVKTSFLSSVSHEIRTPMNAIVGLNTLALHDPNLPEKTRGYLEKISHSSQHLMHLINDVLDMNRIDSGRLKVREAKFDFQKMLEQINDMIQAQCQEKNLRYDFKIVGDVDEYYIGDEMKLRQILINILGNAVKYTSEGSVGFIVELLTKYGDFASLKFTVKDTGIGMDKAYLPKIFEPFSQEDIEQANKYGSTGLGMAITKNIIDMLNGKIEVDSVKDVGSIFTVTISLKIVSASKKAAKTTPQPKVTKAKSEVIKAKPKVAKSEPEIVKAEPEIVKAEPEVVEATPEIVEAAPEIPEEPEVVPEEPEVEDLAGKRVLIAEDLIVNADILKDILELREIKSERAENGKVAAEMFEKSAPKYYDAILMDIRMPVMDGLKSARTIRALDRPDAKTIPIIAVTANAFAEDVQRSLQAGMNAHLSKPIEPDKLFETLEKLIFKK